MCSSVQRVLASLVPRCTAAGGHGRGEQHTEPPSPGAIHEVWYSYVHASALVMTGDVLDAA
jgi:hypothetical protein